MKTHAKLSLKLLACLSFLMGGTDTTLAIKINNAKHFDHEPFHASCILTIFQENINLTHTLQIPAGKNATYMSGETCKNCTLKCQVGNFSTNMLSAPPKGWPGTKVFYFAPNIDPSTKNIIGFTLDTPHEN